MDSRDNNPARGINDLFIGMIGDGLKDDTWTKKYNVKHEQPSEDVRFKIGCGAEANFLRL